MRYFLILASVCVAMKQTETRAASAQYLVTSLIQKDGTLLLLGGQRMRCQPVPSGGEAVFIDEVPNANWAHSATLLIRRADRTVLEKVALSLPPEDLRDDQRMQASLANKMVESRDPEDDPVRNLLNPPPPIFKIDSFEGKYRVKDPSRFYALVINGRAFLRHWNDTSFLYRVLTQVYGYLPAHIRVLDSVYQTLNPDLDGDGTADILFGSSLAEVKGQIESLSQVLRPTDQLLLVVNDHGILKEGKSFLVLKDSLISALDFGSLLKPIPAALLAIYAQCFSGAFVRPSLAPRRVAAAAATDQELSWSTPDFKFDAFLYAFIQAFAFQNHEGVHPPLKETKSSISAREAFSEAVGLDHREESPLMEAWPNSGGAEVLGFGDLVQLQSFFVH